MILRSVPRGPTETFTRAQALHAGYASHEIAAAVRSGRWLRVRRGTYAVARTVGLKPTATQEHLLRVRAIAATVGSRCVVSHQSAVLLHGFPVWGAPLEDVHLTYVGGEGTSRSRAGVIFHRSRHGERDAGIVDGVRVSTPARALVGMACGSTFEAAVCSMDAALKLGSTSPSDLADAISQVERLRGVGAARRAAAFADGAAESVGESRLRVAMHELGLPTPVLQQEFRSDGRVIARVDFWWPDANVIGEFDGLVKYRGTMGNPVEVVIAEKLREDALRALTGSRVVRVTWAELSDRARLERTLRSVLDHPIARRVG